MGYYRSLRLLREDAALARSPRPPVTPAGQPTVGLQHALARAVHSTDDDYGQGHAILQEDNAYTLGLLCITQGDHAPHRGHAQHAGDQSPARRGPMSTTQGTTAQKQDMPSTQGTNA